MLSLAACLPVCCPPAGTATSPPVNPMLEYVVGVLGLMLRPKRRDGLRATALYDG